MAWRCRNEFAVSFAVFDSDLDLNRAKYEFFDAGGAIVAGLFEMDFSTGHPRPNLVRGQSFAVTQHFTEAGTHPEVVAVRVTIFDGETNLFEMVAAGSTIKRADSLADERLATMRVPACK